MKKKRNKLQEHLMRISSAKQIKGLLVGRVSGWLLLRLWCGDNTQNTIAVEEYPTWLDM